MSQEFTISSGPLPGSEKIYVKGEMFDIEVPMRRINLTPTVDTDGTKIENEPVSFVLLWRNGDFPTNGGHYFSAFRGCYSEKDFMDFSRKDQILFEDDLPDMYKPLK